MMNGVSQVLQRIQAIEKKFLPQQPVKCGENFQAYMNQAAKITNKSKVDMQPASMKKVAGSSETPQAVSAIISKAAHKYGVDPKLVDAVAQAESNYTTDVVSNAGAVGVMQLMPETANALGVENIYDPSDNIEGGTKYLKQLLNTFDGDVEKAVAAYNAGPQAVKNYNGIPPYAETQDYVKKVLDIYK